ncbi:MAG: hypothetical protein J4478_03360 [Candidatus Diapherotrites archaeon]|uniref:Lipoprotein n=1 Tax=Candidatus Iainarchaeum sp. TaxID=3101447 RepID=A0A8T4KW97_9ARCH|nr:hypothetical protein [Candidatus Diapherotrites archaeon]
MKIKLAIIGIILTALILSGCSQNNNQNNAQQANNNTTSDSELSACKTTNDPESKLNCFVNLAISRNKVEVCENAEPNVYPCYSDFAFRTNNEQVCNQINNSTWKTLCIKRFAESNPSLCSELKNDEMNKERDYCYSSGALKSKNGSFCQKIEDKKLVASCYSNLALDTNNVSFCDQLKNDAKAYEFDNGFCYSDLGIQVKSPTICEKSELFSDDCMIQLAESMKDGTLCERVTDDKKRNICYNHAGIATNDAALCDKIVISQVFQSSDISLKDSCYSEIAKATKNKSLCEKVIREDQKTFCISQA